MNTCFAKIRRLAVPGVLLLLAVGAAACTSDSSPSSSPPPSTSGAPPSAPAGGQAAGQAGPTATSADRANPSTLHFNNLRNVRYCEIFLINSGKNATQIYNTTGLDNCPADRWNSLDPATVASQNGAQSVFKNGPRYWVLDQLTQPNTKQIGKFNDIEAKWWGQTTLSGTGGASAAPPYTETLPYRPGSEWFYLAGTVVNELIDPGGKTYVMQAYSQIVNPNLTIEDLPNLAYSLKLPSGWKYRTRVLTQNLTTETDPSGMAHVIQDDLQNSYQLIGKS